MAACGGGGSTLPDDPAEAVRQAARNQMQSLPLRVTIETEAIDTESAGKTTTYVIEYESPERVHMTMEDMEVLLVDGKGWRKEGDAWVEDALMATVAAGMAENLNPERLETLMGTITEAALVGEEQIDGQAAQVYEYSARQEMMGMEATTKTRLWVRIKDGLPLRQEVESDAVGVQTHTVMTMEYDPGIRVAAP